MRVDRSIIVVGAFLSILGAALVYNGYGFVQVERGWTEVIAGTTVFSTGLVLIALGFILRALSVIAASADKAALLLAKGRVPATLFAESAESAESAEPGAAFAGTIVAPAFAPQAELAGAPEAPPEPEFQPAGFGVAETAGAVLRQEEPEHPAPVFSAPLAEEPLAEPPAALQPEFPAQSEPRSPAAKPLSWMIRPAKAKAEPAPPEPSLEPEPAPEPAYAEPDYRERRLQRVNFRETAPQPPVPEKPVSQETVVQEPVVQEPVLVEPLYEAPVVAEPARDEHALHEISPPLEPVRQPAAEAAPAAVDWLDEVMAEADPFFRLGAVPSAEKTKHEAVFPDAPPEAVVEPEAPAAIALSHEAPAELGVLAEPDLAEPEPAFAEPVSHQEPPHEHVEEHAPQEEAGSEAERPPLEVIGQYEANGTHYIMYADGSIDAETAHGAYRFASMEELKHFIESQQ